MKYAVDPSAMALPFFVPASVVDKHLRLASGDQLKVLLAFLRNLSLGFDEEKLAEAVRLPVSEVSDALEFWAQAGLLTPTEAPTKKTPEAPKKAARSVAVKPSREEIAVAASEDRKLALLLQEAEMKFARALRGGELQTLAWLYLDHGMDASLILMLVEYAVGENCATISFIEKTALSWLDAGVSSITDAEEMIEAAARRKTAWSLVCSAFGMEYRKPSDNELNFAEKWVSEWHFTRQMLTEAYNRCVDSKGKLSMPYINGILEKWFKGGITTPEAISDEKAKTQKDEGMATYDKNLVEQILNKD